MAAVRCRWILCSWFLGSTAPSQYLLPEKRDCAFCCLSGHCVVWNSASWWLSSSSCRLPPAKQACSHTSGPVLLKRIFRGWRNIWSSWELSVVLTQIKAGANKVLHHRCLQGSPKVQREGGSAERGELFRIPYRVAWQTRVGTKFHTATGLHEVIGVCHCIHWQVVWFLTRSSPSLT